ncbi:MAG: hypothetical protein ACE5E2_04015, partial [Candidatus Binatia bacterium]
MRTAAIIAIFVMLVSIPLSVDAAGEVRLSTNRSTQAVVNEVADQKGFFAEQGLKVRTFSESSGNVSLQAVAGGS